MSVIVRNNEQSIIPLMRENARRERKGIDPKIDWEKSQEYHRKHTLLPTVEGQKNENGMPISPKRER